MMVCEDKENIIQTELIRALEEIITDLENGGYCNDGKIEKRYQYDDYKTHIQEIYYNIQLTITPTKIKNGRYDYEKRTQLL